MAWLWTVLIAVLSVSAVSAQSMITIRGGPTLQKLPMQYMKSCPIYTFDAGTQEFSLVEGEGSPGGFVNPTSFKELFLPADLPLPRTVPALGVCLTNGLPRFIMPSLCLTLQTPDRLWRNRGVCSAPRAAVWIDTFSPLVRPERLSFSCFGQSVPDLRFLEDIDGTGAWQSQLVRPPLAGGGSWSSYPSDSVRVSAEWTALKTALSALPTQSPALWSTLSEGYTFIDVPLTLSETGSVLVSLPKARMKLFLSDFDEPRRLVGVSEAEAEAGKRQGQGQGQGLGLGQGQGPGLLDDEPCGEMEVEVTVVAAGRDSEFLPEGYRDLYDEGNIIFDD